MKGTSYLISFLLTFTTVFCFARHSHENYESAAYIAIACACIIVSVQRITLAIVKAANS